jgi:hypothetical protein
MEQVADISAAFQEIPHVLQDPKIRCHVDKNLILFTHPEWDQSSSRPSTRFLKVRFNPHYSKLLWWIPSLVQINFSENL